VHYGNNAEIWSEKSHRGDKNGEVKKTWAVEGWGRHSRGREKLVRRDPFFHKRFLKNSAVGIFNEMATSLS